MTPTVFPASSEPLRFPDLPTALAHARTLLDQGVESVTVDADGNVRGATTVVPAAI